MGSVRTPSISRDTLAQYVKITICLLLIDANQPPVLRSKTTISLSIGFLIIFQIKPHWFFPSALLQGLSIQRQRMPSKLES
jgi:hypothetical protein